MTDLALVLAAIVFFVLCGLLARACERF